MLISNPRFHRLSSSTFSLSLSRPTPPPLLLVSPPSKTLISKAASSCSPANLASLLCYSAAASRPHILSVLISAGDDVNSLDPYGKPPIALSVSSGCANSVSALLAAEWGFVMVTTPNGILDHEEAIKQNVGGQVLGYFH
ncbi:hypothetical protein J5N97_024795 [Dioscorea zingiberensis]|uniref:Small ribosomal subunit protein uS8c n=1 Tax=Dioscorea zingiberensis TaxID=325984 RepID=A0A9D5H9E0_9LILI|nr:hypothetical protein J5N97_024795 [Dioscorea zingiberensis]